MTTSWFRLYIRNYTSVIYHTGTCLDVSHGVTYVFVLMHVLFYNNLRNFTQEIISLCDVYTYIELR